MGRIAEALKKAQRERISTASKTPLLGRSDKSALSFRLGKAGPIQSKIHQSRAHEEAVKNPETWVADPEIVTLTHPQSRVAEQYRAARTWLLARVKPGERQCVTFAGSLPGEGTSVSTANLAVVMSEVTHMRVLALDANLRNPSLARLLRLPSSPGLTDVLSGREKLQNAVIATPRENLFLLPAGSSPPPNPAELLNSTIAADVFDQLRDSFDYILVDTPAIQDCSDVGVIGALCSGIVMIVRMHKTPAPIVQQSIQWLQANRLNVIGCLGAGLSPDDRD